MDGGVPHCLDDDGDVVPNGELVVELVGRPGLLDVGVEAHEGRGQVLLADRVRHDPRVHLGRLLLDGGVHDE